ncbi:MAG: CaiB/BaiF CoA transferase family protein [Cumulibacter sp.]
MSENLPLSGVRVLDLSWVMVGPMSARYLADLGAQVIKVETATRIDPLRLLGPFKGCPDTTNSLSYQFINAGKKSVAINLQTPRGRQILLDLVADSDVLLQSYTPGVMERLGLDDDVLKSVNPKLIYISTSVFGSFGPRARTSGVGTTGAAYSGAGMLVGWPDLPPTGPFGPWTDAVTPRYVVATTLAALRRVRGGGDGCRIDVAQAEAGLQFVAPAYLEFAVNGRNPKRRGSRLSTTRAPSDVYQCSGVDSWIAIDVENHQQWAAFAHLGGQALQDARFDTLVGRLRHLDVLNDAVARWAAALSAHQAERRLQSVGIPSHAVTKGTELLSDEDLASDEYFVDQCTESIGDFVIRRAQCEIEPAGTVAPAPADATGDSTAEVLTDLLGYDHTSIDRLVADGVLV